MYSHRDKILKKKDEKHSEIEDEVANALFELENSAAKDIAETVKLIKFTKAEAHTINAESRVLQITVPYATMSHVRKVQGALISHLENKFKCPVIIVFHRTIVSKYRK
jgi:hypothetical protein